MNLIAYVDESYILDGKKDVVAIGGWLADAESVKKFGPVWQKVLDSYGASHFHFHEYVDKKHLYSKTNQYDGWDELKREVICLIWHLLPANWAFQSADALRRTEPKRNRPVL